jgi:enoyl-CoA hydratase/carnithine racemase
MTTQHVLYNVEDAIATITLNQPELRNPISESGIIDALIGALEAANADAAVRCAILTAAGTAFSSGGNVRAMADGIEQRRAAPTGTLAYYNRGIQRIPLAFERIDIPVICAVNGPAVGAGLDLVTMCDIRIAAESARFAESFVKMGIVAGDGGAWLLPRAVGYQKASEMALTGDMISAQEALACGLVLKVVPDAELMPAARALALRIAANPPHAVRLTKRLMREGRHTKIDTLLEMSAAFQALMHTTADHAEAAHAFLEKRKPVFKGD